MFKQYFEGIINMMKKTINEVEFETLSLQTKSHFNQFMQLIKSIKSFKKHIKSCLKHDNLEDNNEKITIKNNLKI